MIMDELKPCPFCGCKEVEYEVNFISCPNCGVAVSGGREGEKATRKTWNRRVPESPASTAIAEEKPKAPASLVEELRSIKIDTITDENTGIDMEVIFPARISEILSRHESVIKQSLTTDKDNLTVRKEVVLAESIKLYAIDSESGIRVPEIDGHYELHGKRGKLIFVEEP